MYERDSKARKVGEEDFAYVHGLDRQRYYNVLCLAWGADPKRFAFAQELGRLPQERAEGCVEEYAQVRKAVQRLLYRNFHASEAKRVKQKTAKSSFAR